MTGLEQLAHEFQLALLSADRLIVRDILMQLPDSSPPSQRLEKLIVPALDRIGEGWENGEVSLSQFYMSGRICEDLVHTLIEPDDLIRNNQPKMAMAVLEDYHMLGKRIIYSFLRASGFSILDYGQVSTEDLVPRVKEDGIEILMISTLMLPSVLRVRDVRTKLNESGTRVKIVVGGAPFRFDNQLWHEVAADAMGRNTSEALKIIEDIVSSIL